MTVQKIDLNVTFLLIHWYSKQNIKKKTTLEVIHIISCHPKLSVSKKER